MRNNDREQLAHEVRKAYDLIHEKRDFEEAHGVAQKVRAQLAAAGETSAYVEWLIALSLDMSGKSLDAIDPISARALTGHITEQMQEHYSSVQLDDKRVAIARLAEHLKSTQVEGLVEGRAKKKKAALTREGKAA